MNWDAVIKSLEKEIKMIADRMEVFRKYLSTSSLQYQADLANMQLLTSLAKALRDGFNNPI